MKQQLNKGFYLLLVAVILLAAALACGGGGDPVGPTQLTATFGAQEFHAQLTAIAEDTE